LKKVVEKILKEAEEISRIFGRNLNVKKLEIVYGFKIWF